MAQRRDIIDLTSSPTGYSTPNVVRPTFSTYNIYSLVLNFWDNEDNSTNDNAEGICSDESVPVRMSTFGFETGQLRYEPSLPSYPVTHMPFYL